MSDQNPADKILHQDAVEDVIDDHLDEVSAQGAVTDLAAASSSYVQAEASATRTRVNLLTQVLRDAGLIPES